MPFVNRNLQIAFLFASPRGFRYRRRMRWLYTTLYLCGFVLLSPLFLYKMWKRGKYRENFWQRFGRYGTATVAKLQTKTAPRCWIQAVSVGEVNLAVLFIRELARTFPQHQIVLTTTTTTGYALARERLPATVTLLYFPQDFPWPVQRAFQLIQPDFIVLMESELWPNFLWEAAARTVPVFLVNARMSPRSARRYRRCVSLARHLFDKLTLVCAQSPDDAEHFIAAGTPRDRVQLTGNLKYDASLPAAGGNRPDFRDLPLPADRPILVAGSTHPGEEEILFDLLVNKPDLFLVLVPRHVERTPEILELAKRKQLPVALRKNGSPVPAPRCLLVNTTGELRWFYDLATVIFVGKSLCGIGGQNIIEAAASGHPVLFGPHMENFKTIAAEFVAAGAGLQVPDAAGLERAITELLGNPARGAQITAAAQRVIAGNRGATERTAQLIAGTLQPASSAAR